MTQLCVADVRAERELTDLYACHAPRLRRIVGAAAHVPDAVLDDACQIAWGQLLRHRDRVRPEAVLSWLVVTARREAVRLSARSERELSLEALVEADRASGLPAAPAPDEQVIVRERLAATRRLPVRQQQLVWLAGLGFSYEEMATQTDSTRRTVERQLLRAKRTLREAA